MDIRRWPMDMIMQLPDHVFGRRFPITCRVRALNTANHFDISEVALPERSVLWQLIVDPQLAPSDGCYIAMALGEQLPTTLAQFNLLPPLIYGYGGLPPEPRTFRFAAAAQILVMDLKIPILGPSKRLVVMGYGATGETMAARVTIVVSSIPNSIPDWMVGVHEDK